MGLHLAQPSIVSGDRADCRTFITTVNFYHDQEISITMEFLGLEVLELKFVTEMELIWTLKAGIIIAEMRFGNWKYRMQ